MGDIKAPLLYEERNKENIQADVCLGRISLVESEDDSFPRYQPPPAEVCSSIPREPEDEPSVSTASASSTPRRKALERRRDPDGGELYTFAEFETKAREEGCSSEEISVYWDSMEKVENEAMTSKAAESKRTVAKRCIQEHSAYVDLEVGSDWRSAASRSREDRTTGKAPSRRPSVVELAKEYLKPDDGQVECLGLSFARLTCSWCLKLLMLLIVIQSMFLLGPLSRPVWVPISKSKACQKSDDPIQVVPINHTLSTSVGACKAACEARTDCQAIDFFNVSGWCNFYATACAKPTATWDEASSYQIAVSCTLHNGTQGILIAGQCMLGTQVPSAWLTISEEVPRLLHSPLSWSLSMGVTIIYTYVMSDWFRNQPAVSKSVKVAGCVCRPLGSFGRCAFRWLQAGGIWRRIIFLIVLSMIWLGTTVHWYGLPPANLDQLKSVPLSEDAWLALSVVILLLVVCKGCRSMVLSMVISISTLIMSVFLNLASCALGACFDTSVLTMGGVAEGLGAAGLLGTTAVGTTAVGVEGALATGTVAEALAVGETVTATEVGLNAQLAVDGMVASEAAIEASAVAESAAAVTAAAEASAATDSAALLLTMCTVQ